MRTSILIFFICGTLAAVSFAVMWILEEPTPLAASIWPILAMWIASRSWRDHE